MKNILLLSGWKQSGKDFTGKYLVSNHGFKRYAFADELKNNVSEQYSINRELLDDVVLKETPLLDYPVNPTDEFTKMVINYMGIELSSGFWTPRALCILEGCMRRVVDPNHWVNVISYEILHNNLYDNFVVTDLRFRSEIEGLSRQLVGNNIVPIRIERFDSLDTNQSSERDLDNYPFKYYLNNKNKTPDELYNQIDKILNEVVYGKKTSG